MRGNKLLLIGFYASGVIVIGAGAYATVYFHQYSPDRRYGEVCAKSIETRLKSPDTYREDNISFNKSKNPNGIISYSGIVTYSSQNEFGALLQSSVRCEFEIDSDQTTFLDSPKENYPKRHDVKIDGKSEIDIAHDMIEQYQQKQAIDKLLSSARYHASVTQAYSVLPYEPDETSEAGSDAAAEGSDDAASSDAATSDGHD